MKANTSKTSNTNTSDFDQFARDQALDAMVREASAKGASVTREQIEQVIENDPEGAAAQRLAQYEQLAQATALALDAMQRNGIDPRSVNPDAMRAAVDAVEHVIAEQQDQAQDDPDPDLDDGPGY